MPLVALSLSHTHTQSHLSAVNPISCHSDPPDSIQAPRDLLHSRNIHADPDKLAPDSDKSLNQPLKQNKSVRDRTTHPATPYEGRGK